MVKTIKLWARASDGMVTVKSIISHPMENGLCKNSKLDGKFRPTISRKSSFKPMKESSCRLIGAERFLEILTRHSGIKVIRVIHLLFHG